MDEKNWPLTSRAIEQAERDARPSDYDLTDNEEPGGDGWVDSGSGPGFVVQRPKLRPDRDKLS